MGIYWSAFKEGLANQRVREGYVVSGVSFPLAVLVGQITGIPNVLLILVGPLQLLLCTFIVHCRDARWFLEDHMDALCHDCRFWRVHVEPDFFIWGLDGYGECAHSKVAYCGDGGIHDLAAKGNNDMLVYCHGGDRYVGANLVVGPDFGCVHFNPKETKE